MTSEPSNSTSMEQRLLGGRYRLERPVGQGGMGTVWLAHDAVLDRSVAVKEVALPPGGDPSARRGLGERLLREARLAARIDHPNAVRVYDVADDGSHPWIVMELLSGRSLEQAIAADGPLPPQQVAAIGLAVVDALDAAHRQGIVHRDVKPGNIQLCDGGRAVLTDFGIATSTADPALTRTGEIVGSPAYMSPERARGASLGPASDLFSLGAALYAAVEGRAPFDRGEPLATLHAVVSEDPPAPRRAGALAPLLAALLAKDPAARPAADAVHRELLAVAGAGESRSTASATTRQLPQLPPPPSPPPSPPRAERGGRKRRGSLLAALALLAAAVIGGAVALPRILPERAPATGSAARAPGEGPFDPGHGPVPANWTRYESGAGWSIATPPGWREQRAGGFLRLRDPQRSSYVAVAAQAGEPEATLRALERTFGASHDRYRNLGVRTVPFRGSPAAEWQFRYYDAGADLRGAVRAVPVGGRTYLVWFQTKPQDWEASQQIWRAMLASFRAG